MANPSTAGDIGTEIILDLGVALAGAAVMQLKIKKPDGTLLTKTATIMETQKLLYAAAAGDLDKVGEYSVQAYVEIAGWKGHSQPPAYFNVVAPIS